MLKKAAVTTYAKERAELKVIQRFLPGPLTHETKWLFELRSDNRDAAGLQDLGKHRRLNAKD